MNQILASSLSLCITLLKSRPQILIIRYTCTVPICRITALFYLPPPLTFLIRSYTQNFRSAGAVRYPVWRVLLAFLFSQIGMSVLNNLDVIHRLDLGKFLIFPACMGLCLATFRVHLHLTTHTTNTIQGIQLREVDFFLVALESNWYIYNNFSLREFF